jgi:hypothetical protein
MQDKLGIRGTRAAMPGHKLYIAATPGTIHYVGRTTDIVRRLRHGHQCRIKSHNGYHGYKWLPLAGLRLFICHLPGIEALAAEAQFLPETLVERLESELVFHIRSTTGSWPASQHEIHFHNLTDHSDIAKLTTATAQQIYELLRHSNPGPPSGNIQAELSIGQLQELGISANTSAP